MILRQEDTAGGRPFNNLLRRLNDADFALIEPHLVPADAAPNVGQDPSIAIGLDGAPIVAHWDGQNGDLRVTRPAIP